MAPSPDRVARRALALAALGWRALVELQRPASAAAQVAAWRAWMERVGLLDELDEEERGLAGAEVGAWTEEQIVARGWTMEGAAVLAWALGLLELPPHHVKIEAPLVSRLLGLFAPEPAAFAGELRAPEELAALDAELRGALAAAPSGDEGAAASMARSVVLERLRAVAWLQGG